MGGESVIRWRWQCSWCEQWWDEGDVAMRTIEHQGQEFAFCSSACELHGRRDLESP